MSTLLPSPSIIPPIFKGNKHLSPLTLKSLFFSFALIIFNSYNLIGQTGNTECVADIASLENNLPTEVNITTTSKPGTNSYFEISINDTSGFLSGTEIPAWCADQDLSLNNNETVDFDVYSSYENLPTGAFEYPENFDLVNWLLNYEDLGNYTLGQIQYAIWLLIDDSVCQQCTYLTNPTGLWNNDPTNVSTSQSLADLAIANGEGYEPGCGDQLAVVLIPDNKQSLIITMEVPPSDCVDDCSIIGTHYVNLHHNSSFGENFFGICENPDEESLPDFYYNTVSNSESPDLNIYANDGCVVVDGEEFDKIKIKNNGCVIFTSQNVFINELKLYKNATVKFQGCTNLIINKKLKMDKNSTFNPDMHQVTLYVDDKVEVKEGSTVNAHIYANDNEIKVKGKYNKVTYMKGLFVGKKVKGYNHVNWEGNAYCDSCPVEYPEPEPNCECKKGMTSVTVSYSGGAGADVTGWDATVIDNGDGTYTLTQDGDKLDKDIWFAVDGNNWTSKIHTSCSKDILGQSFGQGITVVSYIDTVGNLSSIDTCPVAPPECDCDGKIATMSVVYDGPNNATISVGENSNGNNSYTLSGVMNGDILEVNLGNIGNWWYWSVNGNLEASIHTSCSDDILGNVDARKSIFGDLGSFPDPEDGDNNGTFLVISHTDTSGNVCSIDYENQSSAKSLNPVEEILSNSEFSVKLWPNPADEYFNLNIDNSNKNQEVNIEVYDIRSRIVHKNILNGTSSYIFGENFKPGLYLVKISQGNTVETIKLIKR